MIILRRNKKIVELYPIGSVKGAINRQKKPIFYSYMKLSETDGRIRPSKFIVKEDNDEILKSPKSVIKLLRKQNIGLATKDIEIEEMLTSLNIPYTIVNICRHCTFEGNITILKKKSAYKTNNEYICKNCAEKEIKRIMKMRGYHDATFNNFQKMLKKTRNLDKILQIFDPQFNPIKNDNLTIYDKITVKKSNKPKYPISKLPIPKSFKKVLLKKMKFLLPIQMIAIKEKLLENENLLAVSATASGKTLIGELTGVPKALKHEKFIFLTPLVALANQKYRDFKKLYEPLGLKVAIKVGSNRIKAKGELQIKDFSVKNADIIVGTYEGVDYLLRSGKAHQLSKLGTVVIDEIHLLDDEERGPRLNGLIKRLTNIYPDTQIVGLSATIKNAKQVANEFNMKLIEYKERPVPLERHLLFTKSEYEKKDIIGKLSEKEYNTISNKGYRGQTIVFTNSRRKTHKISQQIEKKGITAAAYHAGLSYSKKVRIEKDFQKQKISTVVTTAALAAGVDFPASQVIFETLRMGNQWLSHNDFSQMLGRAGRPSFHDIGKIYLLPELNKEYDNQPEDEMAIELLDSDVDNIHVHYNEDSSIEQVLADICAMPGITSKDINKKYDKMNIPLTSDMILDILFDKKLIKEKNKHLVATDYGRAVSASFLSLFKAEYIRKHLNDNNIRGLVEHVEPFSNAYLTNRLTNKLSKALKTNVSTRLFADSTRDILSSGDNIAKLDPQFIDKIIDMQIEFMACECEEKPFCDCLEMNISDHILNRRLHGYDPLWISREFMSNYEIQIYPGDIYSWLDSIIRVLEAVSRISLAFKNKKVSNEANNLIQKIEKG